MENKIKSKAIIIKIITEILNPERHQLLLFIVVQYFKKNQ